MNQSPHDLAPAYALDALDGMQRFTFEAHLDSCAACMGDVLDVRDASELLSVGVTQTPPAALRQRVLTGAEVVAPGAAAAPEPETPEKPSTRSQPRRRRWLG